MRKLVGGALLSGVLLIGLAAPAQGATTIGQTFTRSLVRGRGNQHWFANLKTNEEDADVDVGSWTRPDPPSA